MLRSIFPGFLDPFIDPNAWYRYRELVAIIPVSPSTIVKFLRKVPHTVNHELVPGCVLPHKRPVRLYPGKALLDVANHS